MLCANQHYFLLPGLTLYCRDTVCQFKAALKLALSDPEEGDSLVPFRFSIKSSVAISRGYQSFLVNDYIIRTLIY